MGLSCGLCRSPRPPERTPWAPTACPGRWCRGSCGPMALLGGRAKRAQPAAEALDEAVAGHIEVVERIVAGGVERGDERHDEGGVCSGGVEDREQLGELAGLLSFVADVSAL